MHPLLQSLVLASGTLDVAAGAQADASAGTSPVVSGGESGGVASGGVTPAAGTRYRSLRMELTLRYRPRFSWRSPSPLDSYRPLLLHQSDLAWSWGVTRRASLRLGLQNSYGDVDYSLTTRVFGPTATRLEVEVLRIVRSSATADLSYQATRRLTFTIAAFGEHSKPLNGESDGVIAESVGAGGSVGMGYALTHRDTVGLTVSGGYYVSRLPSRFLSGTSAFGWRHQFDRDATLSTDAGVGVVRDLEEDTAEVFPVVGANFEEVLVRDRNFTTRGHLALRTTTFFDPLISTLRPVVEASAGLDNSTRDWTFGVTVSGSTAATGDPLEPPTDETSLAVVFPVSYRLGRDARLFFGAQFGARGPHWADSPFTLGQYEALGFAGVGWAAGTANANSWVL